MARGRLIDQRISKSDKLAALKADRSRVLYFLIYPHTDCEGRYSGDPREIKEECCPRLRYSIRRIAESIVDLDRVNLFNLYEADGHPWIEFTRFDDFQSIRKDREAPSKIPPYSGLTPEDARRTPALYLSLSLSLMKEGRRKDYVAFDTKTGAFLNITEELKDRWRPAYPACDIELCIRQAAEWLVSNPNRIKSNYQRFLTSWLKREQDKGGTRGKPAKPGDSRWLKETKLKDGGQ